MNILTETLAKNPVDEQQIPAGFYLTMAGLGFGLGMICAAARTESEKSFLSLRVVRLMSAGAGMGLGTILLVGGILTQEPKGIAMGVIELAAFTAGYLGMQ